MVNTFLMPWCWKHKPGKDNKYFLIETTLLKILSKLIWWTEKQENLKGTHVKFFSKTKQTKQQ